MSCVIEDEAIEWHPARLIRENALGANEGFALIVLNQPLHHLNLTRRLWKNASTCIAADGGANCLFEAGGRGRDASFDSLGVIIGDLDSLRDEVRAYFESRSAKVIHDPDQYSTDFGKAVKYVRDRIAEVDIVAIGGLGGRVDQGLSQLHHLYLFQQHPRYADGRMYLFSGESLTFLLKSGHHRIVVREPEPGPEGERGVNGGAAQGPEVFDKYVGIIPVKEPSRITTRGLEWDVADWDTEFGGQMSTSNHVLPDTKVVEVTTTRDVLFTIALRPLSSTGICRGTS
ncbi:thiamine pyrophosphokinase [Diplogelasinospora grovesii]|uniref:Thiamine pyrophosphokinase n=1 Tax=Diplogelasinospora grovesii TaxID=303347 RepID=A0AAN6N210_9PEZI|nr:thiamine pyrophosphokinase [Diplogelasinospora grovesii]